MPYPRCELAACSPQRGRVPAHRIATEQNNRERLLAFHTLLRYALSTILVTLCDFRRHARALHSREFRDFEEQNSKHQTRMLLAFCIALACAEIVEPRYPSEIHMAFAADAPNVHFTWTTDRSVVKGSTHTRARTHAHTTEYADGKEDQELRWGTTQGKYFAAQQSKESYYPGTHTHRSVQRIAWRMQCSLVRFAVTHYAELYTNLYIQDATTRALNWDTTYYYRVGSEVYGWSDEYSFTTPKKPGTSSVRVAAFGDMGLYGGAPYVRDVNSPHTARYAHTCACALCVLSRCVCFRVAEFLSVA
jgi:hypothetical protein